MDLRSQLERTIASKKILIVDDYFDVRKSMCRMIEAFGAKHVDDAATGEAALEMMARTEYDLILCDYNLGKGKDGQQVLEEAKLTGHISYSCGFMMVSAENNMGMVMGALEYMPDEYLQKPFTRDVLKPRVQRLLRKKAELKPLCSLVKHGDYRKSIALINGLLKTSKNVVELLRIKSELSFKLEIYDEIVDFLSDVLAQYNVPWAKLDLGKTYYYLGNFEKAAGIFRDLVNENGMYVHAYDWLSETLLEMEDSKEAQQILMKGAAISPKSLTRQRSLGNISYGNEDMETANKSYKAAIEYGKNSALRQTTEFTSLAKVMSHQGQEIEALKVIASAYEAFKGDPEAMFQTGMVKSAIYRKQGLDDAAKDAMEEAQKCALKIEGVSAADAATELAQMCLELGNEASAIEILEQVIRNNHENEEVLAKIQGVFDAAGLKDKGTEIIATSKKEMTMLNNTAVQMVKEGNLEGAATRLLKASDGAPDNKTINLNAAQVLLTLAEDEGGDSQYLDKARVCLNNVERIGDESEKYNNLVEMYQSLFASQNKAANG